MAFIHYLLQNKADNAIALCLYWAVSVWFLILNLPYISFMNIHVDQLLVSTPFYGVPFTLNLFNFDPSMYYGFNNISVIHPFLHIVSGLLSQLAAHWGNNLFFLLLQSLLNAFSCTAIYFYLRRSGTNKGLSITFAVMFAISSYTLFTALIPDSYPYAQLILILTVLYLQYSREKSTESFNSFAYGALAFISFAVTSALLIPVLAALVLNHFRLGSKTIIWQYIKAGLWAILLLLSATILQQLFFEGRFWAGDLFKGITGGGLRYAAKFHWNEHWQIAKLLGTHPIWTPDVMMISSKMVAVVSDLSKKTPIYAIMFGSGLYICSFAFIIKARATREAWVLSSFIWFAVILHIAAGFGLATFRYDMYLYAGHFLFAVYLLAGRFITELRSRTLRQAATGCAIAVVVVLLVHNSWMHKEVLRTVDLSYQTLVKMK